MQSRLAHLPTIPEQLGGDRPRSAQVLISAGAASAAHAIGLDVTEHAPLSSPVSLLWEGKDTYVIRLPGSRHNAVVQIARACRWHRDGGVRRTSEVGGWMMVASVLWFSLAVSMVFTLRAFVGHSWLLMWVAALASFVFSIASMFSIGAFVFVLTSVQLATIVAMRFGASLRDRTLALLVGLLVWVAIVPMQIWGPRWLLGFGIYQVVGLLGLLVVLLPLDRLWWRLS